MMSSAVTKTQSLIVGASAAPGVGVVIVVVGRCRAAFHVGSREEKLLVAKHEHRGATFERRPQPSTGRVDAYTNCAFAFE